MTQVQPQVPTSSLEKAQAAFQKGRFAEAVPFYQEALQTYPHEPLVWANLGISLKAQGHMAAALVSLRRAFELKPDSAGILKHIIFCLIMLNRKDEVLQAFETLFRLAPGDREARTFYAFALREFDMNEKALAQYDGLDLHEPDYIWCRADILLRLGRFKEGWKDFEIRWQLNKDDPLGAIAKQEKTFKSKRWCGEDLRGKTIMVYEEQGFGDSILCSRYIPMLKAKGARVIFRCRRDLHRLFSVLPGLDKMFVEGGDAGEAIDYHAPVMSLPGLFNTEVSSIPPAATLFVPSDVPAGAKGLLDQGKDRFRVGIVWAGKPSFAGNYKRSAAFTQFLPLAQVPGVQLYSLQKGPAEKELAEAGAEGVVLELGPHLKDFADTAAVLKHLDLVIMTDSAVAHVAGSIGCPVWNLLSNCAFWVYLMDREDSPWYSSMRFFRQQTAGDWSGVFKKTAAELEKAVALKKAGAWPWRS